MSNAPLMIGLGQGLQTAGKGFGDYINLKFQADMEARKQQSLAELENRRLDIMEAANKADQSYKQGMLQATTGEAFDKAKQQFYERMDGMAADIAARLPDEAAAAQAQALLKNVMRDEDLMLSFMTKAGDIDTEKLGEYVDSMASAMPNLGFADNAEAKAAITRFAGAMSREWQGIQKRFPQMAADLSPADLIDQLPSFYRLNPLPEAPANTASGGGGLMGPPAPPPPSRGTGKVGLGEASMSLAEKAGGLMSSTADFLRGYALPPKPTTLTPSQQRAYELGFVDQFGKPTGIRQVPNSAPPVVIDPTLTPTDDYNLR